MRTTLCYIEKDGAFLMLYRNKKEKDANEGKWLGIGGKLEEGEAPAEAMLREVKEETGLTIEEYFYHGIIHFVSDIYPNEDMYLYTASKFSGELDYDCDEGTLKWIPKDEILSLNLWEGDKHFLQSIINGKERFSMTLKYEGEKLVSVEKRNVFSCCTI